MIRYKEEILYSESGENKLPREAVEPPFLELLIVRLEGLWAI